MLANPADLYSLDFEKLATLPGLGQKSADNLKAAIDKSRGNDLSRLLCAFGIRQVGVKAAKVLASHFGTLDALMNATEEALLEVPDVGKTTADALRAWFQSPQSQDLIARLRAANVNFTSHNQVTDTRFAGKTFVLTGALRLFTPRRGDSKNRIVWRESPQARSPKRRATSSPGENAGSKLKKANELGIPVLSEQEFLDMLQ